MGFLQNLFKSATAPPLRRRRNRRNKASIRSTLEIRTASIGLGPIPVSSTPPTSEGSYFYFTQDRFGFQVQAWEGAADLDAFMAKFPS